MKYVFVLQVLWFLSRFVNWADAFILYDSTISLAFCTIVPFTLYVERTWDQNLEFA